MIFPRHPSKYQLFIAWLGTRTKKLISIHLLLPNLHTEFEEVMSDDTCHSTQCMPSEECATELAVERYDGWSQQSYEYSVLSKREVKEDWLLVERHDFTSYVVTTLGGQNRPQELSSGTGIVLGSIVAAVAVGAIYRIQGLDSRASKSCNGRASIHGRRYLSK